MWLTKVWKTIPKDDVNSYLLESNVHLNWKRIFYYYSTQCAEKIWVWSYYRQDLLFNKQGYDITHFFCIQVKSSLLSKNQTRHGFVSTHHRQTKKSPSKVNVTDCFLKNPNQNKKYFPNIIIVLVQNQLCNNKSNPLLLWKLLLALKNTFFVAFPSYVTLNWSI